MSSKPPSRLVFVGNIPYGISEEQLVDIFSGAGTVLNIRLVYDKESGKPKGFGFIEYPDIDSASSAVRNLNDHDVMGRRIRVDFSNEKDRGSHGDDGERGNRHHNQAPTSNGAMDLQGAQGSLLPPLPAGKDLPPGVTASDEISRTLQTLPPSQLLDILTQMKMLATQEPTRASELLSRAPQLSYAVFQALLLMGLVDYDAVSSVLEPGQIPGGAPGAPPPQGHQGYGVPPPQQHMDTPPPAAAPGVSTDLIKALLELPQEQIDRLPEAERLQVLQLRAQYAGQRL